MNPERYKRVDQVFQQALSQRPERLDSFLRQACSGDDDLRREVESLIEHDREAKNFIDAKLCSGRTAPPHGGCEGQKKPAREKRPHGAGIDLLRRPINAESVGPACPAGG